MTDDTTPEIRFESRLTEQGYRGVMLRVSLMRLRYVLPVAAFFVFNALGRGDLRTAWILGAMTLGTVFIVVLYANWASGSPTQRGVYEPVSYRTTPEGLEFTSGERSGLVAWDTIRRWEYVREHYLLHVGSTSYVLVPAAAFAGQDAGAFEAVLRAHVTHGPRRMR